MGIEKMLWMYLLQIWFHLPDPATEDAFYDSNAMRKFAGINFLTESVPDETTLRGIWTSKFSINKQRPGMSGCLG